MAKRKTSQAIMVWFLPLIVLGGLFVPALGYLVFFMMLFFLVLSYFRGRFWCAHLCPRGAFLDLVLSRVSLKKRIPPFLLNQRVRWIIFFAFMVIFIVQFIIAPKTVSSLGFIFVRICLITTLIAIVVGIPLKERTWCAVCPMGTLQAKLGTLQKGRHKGKKSEI